LKSYPHLTVGLQSVLLHRQRGYVNVTKQPVLVPADKIDAIASKWVDAYGINLPAWKRHQRKQQGLPNAVCIDLPVLRDPYKRQLVLMSTRIERDKLHKDCPFLREQWTEKIRIQDFIFVEDEKTHDRKVVDTIKLAPDVLGPLVKFWTDAARRGEWSKSCADMKKAVALYPMFSGVRAQLRREIGGLKKLFEMQQKKNKGKDKESVKIVTWPGPDPEALPIISGFRAQKEKGPAS